MTANLTITIHQFAETIDGLHVPFATQHKLSPLGMMILYELFKEDKQMPSQLAQHVGRAATSFTPILDTLERGGFVSRKQHPKDRRAVQIVLTDKAKALRKDITDHVDAVNTRLKDMLSARIWSVKTVDALFAPLPETQASYVPST